MEAVGAIWLDFIVMLVCKLVVKLVQEQAPSISYKLCRQYHSDSKVREEGRKTPPLYPTSDPGDLNDHHPIPPLNPPARAIHFWVTNYTQSARQIGSWQLVCALATIGMRVSVAVGVISVIVILKNATVSVMCVVTVLTVGVIVGVMVGVIVGVIV